MRKHTKKTMGMLEDESREFERYHRVSIINWTGCIFFAAYLASLVFYIWVRITKTLDLGPYIRCAEGLLPSPSL